MKKFVIAIMALSMVVLVSNAADDKMTNKEIMAKSNGKMGLVGKINGAMKAATVNWDDVQKMTKELSELGATLAKNEPKKGDKDSWSEKAKGWADLTKAADEAAQKKDKKAASEAMSKLGGTCKGCHMAHR